jgi:hypothetical protein
MRGIFIESSPSVKVVATVSVYHTSNRIVVKEGQVLMSVLLSSVESFTTGQRVLTGFGPGVVSAISRVDSIIYVTLSNEPAGLYLMRPEQVEPFDGLLAVDDRP